MTEWSPITRQYSRLVGEFVVRPILCYALWAAVFPISQSGPARDDPTPALLRECVNEFDPKTGAFARRKVETTLAFLEMLNGWYDEMKGLPVPLLVSLLRMRGKVQKFPREAV